MRRELDLLKNVRVVVGLGKIGFDIAFDRLRERGYVAAGKGRPRFAHGAEYTLRANVRHDIVLLGSYHPSRQNTNTRKLTLAMLRSVFARASRLIRDKSPRP